VAVIAIQRAPHSPSRADLIILLVGTATRVWRKCLGSSAQPRDNHQLLTVVAGAVSRSTRTERSIYTAEERRDAQRSSALDGSGQDFMELHGVVEQVPSDTRGRNRFGQQEGGEGRPRRAARGRRADS
jgi:hypothetical protein